ncbi:MAG: D-alanyl-D-alanine carboxypeptidase/D-alanyl-D-alanine-endopeptidase [Acidobacteriota bacterium]|nr:D-alanyl-D-alanine carboxypeptidase/D-alanyl-D-alanine-endopeptidase [Acidobacteriota bacterium]
MHRGVWAVDVVSMATGEHLYSLNAGRWMMPASNMKIVTLAAAAETLGWDYRFRTTLEALGSITNGVLHGDLIVRGNGDPTIGSRNDRAEGVFQEWIAALGAAGVSAIEGRIVGDDQSFDEEGLGAGWAWDYLQYRYAAPVGALEINENSASLDVLPGSWQGAPAVLRLAPGSGLTLLNRAITGPPGSQDVIEYRRRIDRPELEVIGSVPADAGPTRYFVAVVNPTLYFVRSLKDALAAAGVTVSGEAVDFDDISAGLPVLPPTPPRVLASTESPPLREMAAVLMKVSQNLYAETLLKALGASRGGLGTAEGGRLAVRRVLSGWGVPEDAYTMYDGSGLSRYNYVTAALLTTILERLHRDPRHREPFLATLPIAGKDGTLASRLERTRADGNALAKTGSIANVRALSGFVRTRDDEVLAFSILANDFAIPAATVEYIADIAVETLANFTRR